MSMCNITGYLYNASGQVIVEGILTLQLAQDMVINGQKVVPFTLIQDLSESSGYVDWTVFPTEGASPAGITYKLEFDPDPDDTARPMKNKQGYFRNYLAVPGVPAIGLGTVISALRGQPAQNYMPIGGTLAAAGDDLSLGSGDTDKRIIANIGSGDNPTIRYNTALDRWEFTNDGTTWVTMLQGDAGALGGDLSGTLAAAVVARIRGSVVSTTAPTATGQILRWNQGTTQYEPSLDGSQLTNLNASNLGSGSVPVARLADITNAQISASAAIAWSKINKAGSTLADLATRSAADLSSGTLSMARFLQATGASKLLGRGSASGGGDFQEITIGTGLTMTGTTLSAEAGLSDDIPLANLEEASGSAKLVGRGDGGAGEFQEISVGSGLSMSGTTLSVSASAGLGDVTGPASATDERIAVFDGTTGTAIKDGGKTIAEVIADAVAAVPAGGIQKAEITLTHAQITGMFASPVTVVAAPGAGHAIVPIRAFISTDCTAGAYGEAYSLNLYYDGANPGIFGVLLNLLNTTTKKSAFLHVNGASINTSACVNKPVQVSNATGAFSGGNAANTVKIVFHYEVIEVL